MPLTLRGVSHDLWPQYSITWRQWRIIDFIVRERDVAESSAIIRGCSGENVEGDGMGTIERTTIYRNLDQLAEAGILVLELKKTIGGRVIRFYRINWSESGRGLPVKPREAPGGFH